MTNLVRVFTSDACFLEGGITYAKLHKSARNGLEPFQKTRLKKGWHTTEIEAEDEFLLE